MSQEEDPEGSAGINSDSDAEFEQMLAEAEEPKPAAAATEEDAVAPVDENATPVHFFFSLIVLSGVYYIYRACDFFIYDKQTGP